MTLRKVEGNGDFMLLVTFSLVPINFFFTIFRKIATLCCFLFACFYNVYFDALIWIILNLPLDMVCLYTIAYIFIQLQKFRTLSYMKYFIWYLRYLFFFSAKNFRCFRRVIPRKLQASRLQYILDKPLHNTYWVIVVVEEKINVFTTLDS